MVSIFVFVKSIHILASAVIELSLSCATCIFVLTSLSLVDGFSICGHLRIVHLNIVIAGG